MGQLCPEIPMDAIRESWYKRKEKGREKRVNVEFTNKRGLGVCVVVIVASGRVLVRPGLMSQETLEVMAYLYANQGNCLLGGWIEKQPVDHRTVFNRFWRRKWMELHPQVVVWYNEPNGTPRAYMMLAPTTAVRESSGKGSSIELCSASGRTLRFRAPDAQQHHTWLKGLEGVLTERRRDLSALPASAVAADRHHEHDHHFGQPGAMLDGGVIAAAPIMPPPLPSDEEELSNDPWGSWDTHRASAERNQPTFPSPPPPVARTGAGSSRHTLGSRPDADPPVAAVVPPPAVPPLSLTAAGGAAGSGGGGSSRCSDLPLSQSDRSSVDSLDQAGSSRSSQRLHRYSLYRMRSLEEAPASAPSTLDGSTLPSPRLSSRSAQASARLSEATHQQAHRLSGGHASRPPPLPALLPEDGSEDDDDSEEDEVVGQWAARSRELRAQSEGHEHVPAPQSAPELSAAALPAQPSQSTSPSPPSGPSRSPASRATSPTSR